MEPETEAPPLLLEWIDEELEYHNLMMESLQAGQDGVIDRT